MVNRERLDRDATVRSLIVAGAALHVVEVGDPRARPLVVLHGGPGEAHDYLRPHLDALSSSTRRVVYYDQRGGGRSPLSPTEQPAGWPQHAADLEALRVDLTSEPIDLLGFSWGALLALLYALEHPGRVAKLVLVSPRAVRSDTGHDLHDRMQRAAARPEVQAFLTRIEQVARDERQARFARKIAPFLADPEIAQALAPVDADAAAATAIEESLEHYDLRPRLASLRGIATLVVRGTVDPWPEATAIELVQALDAQYLTLEHAGHAPFAEAHADFVAAVSGFLDRDA